MRPVVLTIGGFDPSAGAGVLADIKTFEQHHVYGLAVNTANTVQNESEFVTVNWVDKATIFDQLRILQRKYSIVGVKFGLIPSFDFITEVLTKWQGKKPIIIWDPILSISAGYNMNHELENVEEIYSYVDVLTPNREEMCRLGKGVDADNAALLISEKLTVYLKGGHQVDEDQLGTDVLYRNGKHTLTLEPTVLGGTEKHGSGCILSASLLANLVKGMNMKEASNATKKYIDQRLNSNTSLLAYHNL